MNLDTMISLDYWLMMFYILGLLGLIVLARRPHVECKALHARLEELEEELARAESQKIHYAAKIAGLAPEAARLLDAVLSGEAKVYCRDGRPATIVGGEVICMRGDESAE